MQKAKKLWKILWLSLLPFLTYCQTNVAPAKEFIATGAPPTTTPENFRVAYVGDIGMSDASKKIFEMIKDEGSGLFVLLGDFDYYDDPLGFETMMNRHLGDVPTLAVVGNHDLAKWSEYRKILDRRLEKIPGINCRGENAVKMRCEYKGIVFALSGVGTMRKGHEEFLREALSESPANFKVCAWHKNQADMQAGNKRNETGWEVYEICREEGAMIATGHEHSYSRTHVLSDFRMQERVGEDDGSHAVLTKGQSFAFVSGLGGRSIRGQRGPNWFERFLNSFSGEKWEKKTDPWWAKVYTADQKAQHSVLFCDYHVDKDPRKARCFLKNIDGQIIDSFTIQSQI